jgi:nucleotide-binding universal stress UspA family protein
MDQRLRLPLRERTAPIGFRTEMRVIEFKQILCPTDLSDASVRSLTYAAAFARWYNARLTVLHVVPTFDPIAVGPGVLNAPLQVVMPMSRPELVDEMRRLTDSAGLGSMQVNLSAHEGDPARNIVDQALAIHADLVVMGTHGRSGFERLLIGSVAEKVLRKAPCPVLLVPPHAPATTHPDVSFKHILCPMDFSPSALQALGLALDLARQSDGVVMVLHALEWLAEEEPRENAHFNVPEYRQYLIDDARRRMQALVADHSRIWGAIDHRVVLGRAYREILGMASHSGTDLIVMGAQGRGGLGLTLFGSTTQQVVRTATCPVLTVRGADPA